MFTFLYDSTVRIHFTWYIFYINFRVAVKNDQILLSACENIRISELWLSAMRRSAIVPIVFNDAKVFVVLATL